MTRSKIQRSIGLMLVLFGVCSVVCSCQSLMAVHDHQAALLEQRADSLMRTNNLKDAETVYKQALLDAQSGSDLLRPPALLVSLGTAYFLDRQFEQAESCLRRASELYEQYRNRPALLFDEKRRIGRAAAKCLEILAKVLAGKRDMEGSRLIFNQAVVLNRDSLESADSELSLSKDYLAYLDEIGEEQEASRLRINLIASTGTSMDWERAYGQGFDQYQAHRFDRAAEQYRIAYAIAVNLGDQSKIERTLIRTALLELAVGNNRKAQQLVEGALNSHSEEREQELSSYLNLRAQELTILAHCLILKGSSAEASKYLKQAQQHSFEQTLLILQSIGSIYERLGKPMEVLAVFEEQTTVHNLHGTPTDKVENLMLLANHQSKSKSTIKQAFESAAAAIRLSQQMGRSGVSELVASHRLLGDLYLADKQGKQAAHEYSIAESISKSHVNILTIGAGTVLLKAAGEYSVPAWSALNLFDGSNMKGWCSVTGKPKANDFCIELPQKYKLASIAIDDSKAQEAGYPGISAKNIEIWGSIRGAQYGFSKIASVVVPKGERKEFSVSASAQWLRFVVVDNWGHPQFTEVMEIEAYGTPIGERSSHCWTGVARSNQGPMKLRQEQNLVFGSCRWHATDTAILGAAYGNILRMQWVRAGKDVITSEIAVASDGTLNGRYYDGGAVAEFRGKYASDGIDEMLPAYTFQECITIALQHTGRAILYGMQFNDSADIMPGAEPSLKAIASVIMNTRDEPFIIEVHTDSKRVGMQDIRISKQQAQSVLNWLFNHGVRRDQVLDFGCGRSDSLAVDTASGRLNARVELTVPGNLTAAHGRGSWPWSGVEIR